MKRIELKTEKKIIDFLFKNATFYLKDTQAINIPYDIFRVYMSKVVSEQYLSPSFVIRVLDTSLGIYVVMLIITPKLLSESYRVERKVWCKEEKYRGLKGKRLFIEKLKIVK